MINLGADNDRLGYTSYSIINQYQKKVDKPIGGFYFNKIIFLVYNKLLKDSGININLPHYWYRYGDQVYRSKMPHKLHWNHESQYLTKVEWNGTKLLRDDSDEFKLIDKTVKEMLDRYMNDYRGIISDVYEYAPYDFQREMLNMRVVASGWRNAINWDAQSFRVTSKEAISRIKFHFPEKDFQDLRKQYDIFQSAFSIILERPDWNIRLVEDLITNFWFLFCYHLRLKSKARENIPRETVKYWEAKIDFFDEQYRGNIADFIIEASKKNPKIRKNALLEHEYIWRLKDIEESKLLLDEFAY